MLKLKNISKVYYSKGFKQTALNDITVAFRKSEFVSILGPSGSGKSTLLNIIGGLDKYTQGNLYIEGVSTRKYSDCDWDNYRSKKVGFIFQNYDLINYQTVLENVLLALNISGKSKIKAKTLAKKALKDVGLEQMIKKKPQQLSGGQMQRVAIARALSKNPDIILCDEPTGALDSQTSLQIMEILKNISKEKLVIMVTHNINLANKYSDRIITIKDGAITYDTNPFDEDVNSLKKIKTKKKSLNKFTTFFISMKNLLTKKSRTILTSVAGSIGIIGISLILSLSQGVQKYIDKIEKETLSSYPISIEENYINYQNIFSNNSEKCNDNSICFKNDISNNIVNDNNLSKFSNLLKNNYENINEYSLDINYNYDIDLNVYKDTIKIENASSYLKQFFDSDSPMLKEYSLVYGRLPEKFDEVIIITDENGKLPLSIKNGLFLNNNIYENDNISYENIININFLLVPETSYYVYENNSWNYIKFDQNRLNDVFSNGIYLKITGILKLNKNAVISESGFIGYTQQLITYLNDEVNTSGIKQAIIENKEINPLTNDYYVDDLSYEKMLDNIGIIENKSPKKIDIYPKNYKCKEKIENIIKKYNKENSDNKIYYTDYLKVFLSSINNLINVISYILIAFIGVSLVVTSIMICIITYISVLERTKEIGILRALGASKKDIKNIFKSETIIIGTISGVIGVTFTLLINKVVDKIIYNLISVNHITYLSLCNILCLIFISIILCLISGLIPAKIASKQNPVISLRSE